MRPVPHILAAIVATPLLAGPAAAEPLTDVQAQALHALEREFDIHRVSATDAESAQAFSEACDAGYNLACQRAAWVVYGEPDLANAADLFESSCEQGDAVACMVVGWHLDRSAPQSADRDRNWLRAARLFKAQCDEGFLPACYDWGWFLYQNKGFKADPRAGVRRWKSACEQGEMASCATLGVLSLQGGTGIARSTSAAEDYLQQACDGGFTDACYHLAILHWDERDPTARDEALGPLCEAGHRDSCWKMAQAYLSGEMKAPSDERLDWYLERGCEVGSANACFEAGRREMSKPEGVDFQLAAERFDRACDLGEMSGCTSLVDLITAEKVEGSVKTAPQAFETACLKRNSPEACTELAMELIRGVDLPRDPARARALLHRACHEATSLPQACKALGESYAEGIGGHRDRTTAAKYYRWACDAGELDACEARGDLLVTGRGITRDDQDALAMYTKACDGGRPSACHKAAVILDEATYVKRDIARAAELYKRACDGGFGAGCHGYGRMLEEGAGGEPDLVGARAAYERGIEYGSVDAMREQARLLWNGLGGKKQRKRARQLAAQACREGDAVACRGAEALTP